MRFKDKSGPFWGELCTKIVTVVQINDFKIGTFLSEKTTRTYNKHTTHTHDNGGHFRGCC